MTEFDGAEPDDEVRRELVAPEMSQVHARQTPARRVFYSGVRHGPSAPPGAQFLDQAVRLYRGSSDREGEVVNCLRDQLTHAVHLGHLHTGDRLPSIREIVRALGVTHHAAVHAYDVLSAEGLVEKRGRSGVYLAKQEGSGAQPTADAARWLVGVLAGACEQGIRLPYLSELLRRWTASVQLRCACIDSDADHRTAFCAEVSRQFGLDTQEVPFNLLPSWEPGQRVEIEAVPVEVRQADVLITTIYHAPTVRAMAEMLGKRVVVATTNPDVVEIVERHLRDGQLTVVCVDSVFADRLRALRGGEYSDRIHVVLADDTRALAQINHAEPVLLTRAAHEKLGSVRFRLLVSHSPSFSPAFERDLSEVIVQLNLEASRL